MPAAISSGVTADVDAVDDGDDQQGDDVVDDDDRQQEGPQAVGKRGPTRASMPSAKAVSVDIATPHPWAEASPRVDGQVDRDRHDHPAEGGEHRQGEAAALAQLADVELAPHLEPDDEEEERHQAVVDPIAEVLGDARVADPDRECVCQTRLVGGRSMLAQASAATRRAEQDDGAAGLGAQELAQRSRQAARPGRSLGQGRANPRVSHYI